MSDLLFPCGRADNFRYLDLDCDRDRDMIWTCAVCLIRFGGFVTWRRS